jgi:single-strand DNA-binding protein
MLNRFTGTGNLTQSPQLIDVKGGYKVCKFSIAINNPIKKTVLFLDIEAWNKTGENCNTYLEKGSSIAIDGRLDTKQWVSKAGENRTKVFCVADNVHFMKNKEKQDDQQTAKSIIQATKKEDQREEEEEEDDVPF